MSVTNNLSYGLYISPSEFYDRLKELAQRFRDYGNKNKVTVKFEEQFASCDQKCGTIACHAGVAQLVLEPETDVSQIYYRDGIRIISRFLGFNGYVRFNEWANHNSDYWGSDQGAYMFSGYGERAFGKKTDEPVTIFEIADWYDAVAGRVLEAINGNQTN